MVNNYMAEERKLLLEEKALRPEWDSAELIIEKETLELTKKWSEELGVPEGYSLVLCRGIYGGTSIVLKDSYREVMEVKHERLSRLQLIPTTTMSYPGRRQTMDKSPAEVEHMITGLKLMAELGLRFKDILNDLIGNETITNAIKAIDELNLKSISLKGSARQQRKLAEEQLGLELLDKSFSGDFIEKSGIHMLKGLDNRERIITETFGEIHETEIRFENVTKKGRVRVTGTKNGYDFYLTISRDDYNRVVARYAERLVEVLKNEVGLQ